jgi:hypothetical protein
MFRESAKNDPERVACHVGHIYDNALTLFSVPRIRARQAHKTTNPSKRAISDGPSHTVFYEIRYSCSYMHLEISFIARASLVSSICCSHQPQGTGSSHIPRSIRAHSIKTPHIPERKYAQLRPKCVLQCERPATTNAHISRECAWHTS